MNYTKEQRDAILASSWPHVKALIDVGDIKGAVKNYVHCGCYIGLSKKAEKIIYSRSGREQFELSNTPEAVSHNKETDRLCLEYRKLMDGAEKKRIEYETENQKVFTTDNDLNAKFQSLAQEINRRRGEWIHLFGRRGRFEKINRRSEYAKAFCKMFRYQLFGQKKGSL